MKVEKKIVSVDVGGTFCDAVLQDGDKLTTLKLLSTGVLKCKTVLPVNNTKEVRIEQNWNLPFPTVLNGCHVLINNKKVKISSFNVAQNVLSFEKAIPLKAGEILTITSGLEAPLFAAHLLTGIPTHQSLPNVELRVGSTKATNALLEHKGVPCIWITNEGLGDLLYIKTQQRPDIFQLDIPEPIVLHKKVIEIHARISSAGEEIYPIEQKVIDKLTKELPLNRSTPIAIALIHSYRNPKHEQKIKSHIVSLGYHTVFASSDLQSTIHLVPRAETTVVNAYLAPIMDSFIHSLVKNDVETLQMNTSAGNLESPEKYNAKDSLFSGPAGGIKAAEYWARLYKTNHLLTFDMGGTSTDTARIDNQFASLRYFSKIGEHSIVSPSHEVETVAAGGGSIIDFVDGKFIVGPKSAGAFPGPACYGQGGPFTITDLNLILNRLNTNGFRIPINKDLSLIELKKLFQIAKLAYTERNIQSTLEGIAKIANEKMANAISKISVAKGHDPRLYALLVFGGAGGLHACDIADILHINKVIIPYHAGIFSAVGISKANRQTIWIKQLNTTHIDIENLKAHFKALYEHGTLSKSFSEPEIKSQKVYLRYLGQNESIEVEFGEKMIQEFESKIIAQFGALFEKNIEIEKIALHIAEKENKKYDTLSSVVRTKYKSNESSINWNILLPGHVFNGNTTIYHDQAAVYIPTGWKVEVQSNLDLVITKQKSKSINSHWNKEVELELFTNRFKAIAEQMGVQLQRSAFSVNVKERLDFSCALVDAKGYLIANAPHIPVHLGSLGICTRLVLEKNKMKEGDIYITNHPLYGGSHLPDITLIKPVFVQKKCVAYLINRAHHAEVGGITPGSMPTMATNLLQEGAVILPITIAKNHKPNWNKIEKLFTQSTYPSRDPKSNALDIKAAIQSLETGEKMVKDLCTKYGVYHTMNQMDLLLNQSTGIIQSFIKQNKGRHINVSEKMDDGREINLSLHFTNTKIIFDFSKSSSTHTGNLNANISIVYSVIAYILRIIPNRDIPLNDGLMKNVIIRSKESFITPRFIEDPAKCPAVVGGNTEVSQRITDTILKAFGLAACSQGTMNNFLFGNNTISYYETIGGGVGATKNAPGRSAIHQHMTNTKITDPEELEFRYPVLLEKFAIRKNSGGHGKQKGGNGIVRKIKFLEPMTVTLIGQHRVTAPYGLKGGKPGKVGKQYLIKNGKKKYIDANKNIDVNAGESVEILTPGGGGYG